MEGAVAAAAYAVEHVVEGAAALAKGLTHPTAPLEAKFTRINGPSIPRSSHSVSVVKDRAYIFGGEISPREPVDNAMHVVTIPANSVVAADYQSIPARSASSEDEVPTARVGHTAAVIGHQIFVFGGRGGSSMAALEEKGRIWVFDTQTKTWSFLDPNPHSPHPEARSYHASTATDHPLPVEYTDTKRAKPEPPAPGSYGTLFIHAGCLSSGGRTSDLWAFDISSRSWAAMPSAPGPARGGTSLAIVQDRLYRFGGFDGQTEVGGQMDYLDLNVADITAGKAGIGTMALSPRGEWHSNIFPGNDAPSREDSTKARSQLNIGNKRGPAARSVCGLAPVTTGQGRTYMLIIDGEGSPSAVGHAGAGKFFDDIWSFQLKSEGNTAASWKDATRGHLVGRETGEAECVEVRYYDQEDDSGARRMIQEGQDKPMARRGWFACDTLRDVGSGGSVLVWGGVGEDNRRLGDGWIISVD